MNYTFTELEGGPLRVFELPQEGMRYSLGVDAATGLGNDNSGVQVLTQTIPSMQVAVYRAQVPVYEFSGIVDSLGRWYNEGLVICEINYPGNAVQDALLQYFHYPRCYMPETHLKQDVDVAPQYGFRTTEATKWMLIHEMQKAIEDGDIIINDPWTIDEMMNFVYEKDSNKANAASGFCDDLAISLMLAYHAVKLYPCIIQPRMQPKIVQQTDPDTKRAWRLFQERMSLRRPDGKREGVRL